MFGNIYKLSDGLYHQCTVDGLTACTKNILNRSDVLETRTIGQKGNQIFKDPKKEECCLICFPFLK